MNLLREASLQASGRISIAPNAKTTINVINVIIIIIINSSSITIIVVICVMAKLETSLII